MSSIVKITSMTQTSLSIIKGIDKKVRTLSKHNQDIITNCCILNWSWTPTSTVQPQVVNRNCSQSTQFPTDIEDNQLFSDTAAQTELFLKDYHQHDLNALDIEGLPNNIK